MRIRGFTIVPDYVVQRYGYVGGLIYGKIARYCEWSEMNICTASNSRLAEELGMGESTIRKYKDILAKDGLIRKAGKRGETDTVTINEEMVLEMNTPLSSSAPTPLPNSDKESIIKEKNKGDILEGIFRYQGKPPDYPVPYDAYLRRFAEVFGRDATKQEMKAWIAGAAEWVERGIRPEDIKPMHKYCRDKGTVIKSPFSITYAYDEIRNQEVEEWNPL